MHVSYPLNGVTILYGNADYSRTAYYRTRFLAANILLVVAIQLTVVTSWTYTNGSRKACTQDCAAGLSIRAGAVGTIWKAYNAYSEEIT